MCRSQREVSVECLWYWTTIQLYCDMRVWMHNSTFFTCTIAVFHLKVFFILCIPSLRNSIQWLKFHLLVCSILFSTCLYRSWQRCIRPWKATIKTSLKDHIRAQTIKSHARGQGYLRFFAVRGWRMVIDMICRMRVLKVHYLNVAVCRDVYAIQDKNRLKFRGYFNFNFLMLS